jgi:hypothetical protein
MNRDVQRPQHQLAIRLVQHAGKVLPADREHWAEAMAAELAHIPDDAAALKWAVGCVIASYSERIDDMSTSRPGLSRWVLCVEMFCFFIMPVLGFIDVLTPPYYTPLRDTVFILSVASLGPIGLAFAFKAVVLNRPALPRVGTWALGLLAGWALLAWLIYSVVRNGTMDLEWWRAYALVAVLPALAAAHLIYLSTRSKPFGASPRQSDSENLSLAP